VYAQGNTWRLASEYHQSDYVIQSVMVGYKFNSRPPADFTVNNLFAKGYYNRVPTLPFAGLSRPPSTASRSA
jgi:outer membrane receptor for ferric coprogen and ferric-rhodotorulic acid